MHDTILSPAKGRVTQANLAETKNTEAYRGMFIPGLPLPSSHYKGCEEQQTESVGDTDKTLPVIERNTYVIGLFTELTSLKKEETKTLTDYVL